MRRAIIPGLLLMLVSLVLGATVFREQVARAAPPIMDVFVTNDETNPVPVQQHGTADVNVTNATLAVKEAGEQPVQGRLLWDFAGGKTATDVINIPDGKRLRIELVTFWSHIAVKQFIVRTAVIGTGGHVEHSLKSATQPDNSSVVSESLRIYADPPNVAFQVELTDPACCVESGSFSGVLIDAS
jgi:hypothetical protein